MDRFVQSQVNDYRVALGELRAGRKRSRWMWYIFPQLTGLGRRAASQQYAIRTLSNTASTPLY